MTALKNRIQKSILIQLRSLDLEFDLHNININGEKKGCSGFITDLKTGACVYVNTEGTSVKDGRVMYRYALDTKDYSSNNLTNGNNHWCDQADLHDHVLSMLASGKAEPRQKNN